jgi:hypothetical protein
MRFKDLASKTELVSSLKAGSSLLNTYNTEANQPSGCQRAERQWRQREVLFYGLSPH